VQAESVCKENKS